MNDAELQDIFQADIKPVLEADSAPSFHPVTVFLGAQPGAGKTRGQSIAESLYPPGAVVPIVGDDFRKYHPDYPRLVSHDPLHMPDITAHAAGMWTGMAVQWANDNHIGSIIEGTWRNVNTVLDSAREAKRLGRATHAMLVAVPPVLSRLGTVTRFYDALAEGNEARWTPPTAHDETVRKLDSNVATIARSGLIDRFTVVNRAGETLYDSNDPERFITVWSENFHRLLTEEERSSVESQLARMRELAMRFTPDNAEALTVLESLAREARG